MKRIITTITALFLLAGVVAQKQVISDPNAQKRNVSGFHSIKISHAIDLFLSQGDEEGVAVSAKNDEYRDKIKTVVENGVLRIWYDEDDHFWKNTGNKRLRAYVSFKTLQKLTASGACDVMVSGTIKAEKLEMNLSGASDFKGAVQTNEMNVDISGASDVDITGTVASLHVEASGASDFKGYDLQAENCWASASGASDIKITVNKELTAVASGASSVHYHGSAVVKDNKTSGASSISKKG
jgi:hypothetical protein